MAHVVSITDGATTITFTAANGYQVEEYDPETPETENGAMPADVAETLQIFITGASGSAVQTRQSALERLLEAARRRRQWGAGPRVFLLLQLDSDAAAWQAEIYDARLRPLEQALRLWPNNAVSFNLHILRAATWEGALTQIPLTNANGSNNTSGLTVWNHDDGGAGHDNYVQIATGVIAGSLPAPVKLELTNTTGGSQNFKQILLAGNAFSDPANFAHILEAEAALVSGGSTASNADSSNGSYVTHTIATSDVQQFTLSQALLQDALGYDFHLLARYRSYTGPIYVRPSIRESSGQYALWTGDEIQLPNLGDPIVDLGVLPLPPGGYSTSYGALRLYLTWRVPVTSVVETDFFALFPANTFRKLRPLAPVANAGAIVDDQIEGRAYTLGGGVETPAVATQGLPLLVWPNVLQRIYFLWSLGGLTAPISQTMTVKAWYRPRRYSFG